ncbi:hypothetical protein SAMN05444417_3353 [Wenxinia saemankumensis]|uniref:Uncharacterized protein n=1 Tax=Wenxinia saemankumensis TaxID=1447782 RepID=A0A1M6HTS7_9RHOB|nr:hypothetical protein SAMN05444417_3353 [Wenxinia saemankumensis]
MDRRHSREDAWLRAGGPDAVEGGPGPGEGIDRDGDRVAKGRHGPRPDRAPRPDSYADRYGMPPGPSSDPGRPLAETPDFRAAERDYGPGGWPRRSGREAPGAGARGRATDEGGSRSEGRDRSGRGRGGDAPKG